MNERVTIRRALISVSDKTGVVEFALTLAGYGVEILSTGGTAKLLRDRGVTVVEVSDHTGFPEILDGRVKTLVPHIHGGILGRRDSPEHVAQMAEHHIAPIDLVAVTLYPFASTVNKGGNFEECIEQIDIGGPALIRAAAKNHAHVVVATDPKDYGELLDEFLEFGGAITFSDLRRNLAARAFARVSAYDYFIASWFARQNYDAFEAMFTPPSFSVMGSLKQILRYGENPHQYANLFVNDWERPGVATALQIQGKELSYNNFNDADAAYECVAEFEEPAVVIVKHANPCGVATGADLSAAWDKALACDPISAYGGIVAVNRPLDAAAAEKIASIFTEVIVTPRLTREAQLVLEKKKNLRVLQPRGLPDPAQKGEIFRSIAGGFLVQSRDDGRITAADLKVVTKRAPSETEIADMLFAWRVAKHVKSNAIVYAKGGATLGVGAGQMNRADSARIAAWRGAAQKLDFAGCAVASDAFFPFADGLEAAVAAGASAVIQPGGSIRDAEVIAAADAAGVAMVFTNMRHFRH